MNPAAKPTNEQIIEAADELFTDLESFIRRAMETEFNITDTLSSGLWERIEADHQPYFDQIAAFRKMLETALVPTGTMHSIATSTTDSPSKLQTFLDAAFAALTPK